MYTSYTVKNCAYKSKTYSKLAKKAYKHKLILGLYFRSSLHKYIYIIIFYKYDQLIIHNSSCSI